MCRISSKINKQLKAKIFNIKSINLYITKQNKKKQQQKQFNAEGSGKGLFFFVSPFSNFSSCRALYSLRYYLKSIEV
jgi:hypothetical protein